jgi:hypothetical protein
MPEENTEQPSNEEIREVMESIAEHLTNNDNLTEKMERSYEEIGTLEEEDLKREFTV